MCEPLYYSSYAVERILERGILVHKIEETVRRGVCIFDSGDRAMYARGRMRVVLGSGALVITAFRMRRLNPKRIMREKRKRQQRHVRELA